MVGNLSKSLYRAELLFLKVIPMLMAFVCLLNTVLSYYDIDWPFLSYLGSVSIFTLAFLYLSSVVFRFCMWHRMFLHYVAFNWALNIIDYYIGIPVSDRELFIMYLAITGVFLFIILYLKMYELPIKTCIKGAEAGCQEN